MPQDPNKPVSLPEWEETVRSHYGIPKELWSAMADQESGGDWKATSPTGVRGKYQVTQRTARQYNLNRDDPFEQVAAAGRYLKEQFDAVKGPDDSSRWYGALARFYGGPSAVDDQGNFSTRSADGVSNPAEHVARVARRIEAMRKRAQDESLAPAQPQATPQAQTAAPADQPAPIQKAIQPLPSEQVDWTRRGPVMPQRPQPSFAGDPNADALQKMMGQATVAGYKIPKTAEDAFKGRQRYATTPQAPKQSQRPGLLQDVAETALPFAAGGLAPIVSKTMPTPAEGSIRQAANVFGQTYSKGLAQIPQGLAQLGEATTRLRQLVPTQAPPDGLGPVSRIFDKPTQALVQGAEQRFPTNKQDQSWMTSKIPQVLGSVGAFATTGAVGAAMGLPSMASSALAGSGMQVASFMEEAKQTGIDPTRINQGIAMAGLTGMTEMFGLGKVLDRFGLKKQIVERGLNILEEAGQEAFQGYLEDLNAKLVAANDPKRNIDPTSADFWLKRGEEAALGAIGGGLFAGADIAVNRIAARPDGGVAKVPDAMQDEAQPEAQPLIGLPRPPRSVRQQMTELQRPGTPPTPEQIDQAETAYRQRKPRKTPLQERMRQMEPTAPLTEDLGTGLSQGQQAGTIEDRWGEAISNSPRPETVKTALEQAEQAQRQFDRSETDGRDTDALTALQRKDQALRAARVKVSRNTPGGLRARQRLFDEIKGNQRKIDQKKQQMQRRKGQPVSQPDAPVTGPMGDANAPTASGPMMPPTSRPSAALPREYTNRIDSNTDYPGGELPRTAGIRPEGQPIELPERTPPQGRGITPKRTPGPIQRPVGPQRPTTPMMGAEGSMMFADRPGMQYQMSKEGERIVREQEERVAEGTLEEGDFLGPRRARPDQPKFGNYGDVAMYLFRSPQPGDPAALQTAYDPETGREQNIHGHDSVFNSPEVKGVLGLTRDANMGAVKDEINKDMARWLQLPADEVSLAQVPPSIWVGWAKMKGLSKTTLDKMYVAFDKATEKAQREGKEPPPVPQRLQTPFAKRQVSPLAGFTKGTNAQTPPTTQAAPRPREGQPTGRQATGSVEQPTRPATPPAQTSAERTGAPTPAADTGELTTGELRQEREKRQELRKRRPFGKDREAARQTEQAREQQAPPTPKSEAAPKPAAAEPEKTYTPEKKTVAGETTRATMPAGGNTMSDTAKQKPTPTPGKVSEKTLTEKGWTKNYSEDFSGPDGATLKRNPETGLWEYTGPGGRAKYDSRRQAIIDIAGKPAPKVEKGEKATPKKRKAQPKPEKQAEAAPAQQPAPAPTPAKKPVADPPAQPAPISVTQIDESINDRARDILMQEKGAYHTPGLRLADQLTAGQMAYLVEKGDLTPQDWDDWVKQAQQENRFRDAAAPIRPPSHLALPVPPEVSSPTAGTRPDAKPVLRFTGSKIAGPGVEGQTAASRLGQRITMLRGLNEQTQAYPGETFDRLDPNQIDEVRDYMIQLGRQQQAQPVAQPEQATPSQAQATPPNLADIMPPPGRPMEMKDLKQKLRDAGMPEGEIDQFILDKKASYEIALMKAYGPDDVKARTTEAERVEMVQDQFGNWYNGATRRTEQETQEAPTAGATRLITKGEIYRDQDGKYFEIVDTVKTGRPAGMLGEQVDRKTSASVDASDLDARIIVQPLKGKPGNFQPLKTVPARGDDRLRQQISQGTAVRVDPATEQAAAATEPAPSARKPQAAETPAQALTSSMSESAVDIAALIDQTLEAEGLTQPTRARTPRQTKPPTSPRKRAATSARKAGREAVAAIDESLKALNELFGGPKLSAGFTFDEDTYRKAKPHFQAAFQHFNASVDNLNQTVQDLIATLRDLYGWGAAEFQKAKPYLVRFMTEWKEAYAGQSMATSEASGASSERAEGVQAISGERPTESGARESRTGRARDAESISGTGDGPVAGERIGDGESTGTVSQRARSRSGERGQRRTERDAPPVAEDTTRTATQPPAAANLPPAYVVTDIETLIPRGKKSKLNANLEAVRLFKRITVEGRLATAEEQQTLARYTGWGAFPDLFNEYNEAGVALKEERAELRQLLTDAEYEEARASTKNAHYTSPKMVGAMWDMMRRLGFKQGRVLEPSVGVGTFFGMMPSDMRSQSRLSAVELDPITGGIAKLLYPQPHASISVKGFEAYDMPDGFHDIVIGNVPFGDYKVHDPRYNKYRAPIHDYFILKSLDQVRPGGVVMVITSTGTLDKQKPQLREAMAAKADLVAAFRLPDGIFEQTAGTAVVTDVLVLRRREPGITGDASWTQLGELPDPDGGRPIPINQYYVQHPDNILGRLDRKSRLYGSGDSHVSATEDFETRLKEAIDRLPADTLTPRTVPVQERLQTALASGDEGLPPGSLVTRKGQLMRREGEQMVSVQLPDATAKRVGDVLPIRDALRSLISAQLEGQPTNKPRQALQDAYDAFVRRHGALRKKGNAELLAGDPSAYLLLSLEKDYNAKTGVATKADIFTKDVISRAHRTSAPKHAGDALAASLFEFNRVDIPYMASALGMAEDALATELVAKKLAFELPSGGWDTAEQYLAGNVRRKLQEAQSAAAVDPKFLANVEALEAVQPEDISIADISVRAGAPWVPAEDIADFAASLVDGKASHFSIKYSPGAAEWYVDWNERSSDRQGRWMAETGAKAKEVYGTPDVDFIQLLGAALNDRPVTVRVKSGDTTVTSPEKTEAAMLKVQDIKDAFTDWIWTDPDRANRLHRYYNDNFNNLRTIVYKGEHYKNADGKFVLPGMNPQFALRPHQIKNVWHAVSTGRLLEASEVGAGKTFIMGSIAMEWRRLGMVKKPAIVVPKARLQATIEELQMLYPGARIMDFGNAFQGDKRQQAAAQTATGDYDMVIMTHEQLDFLPMKPEVVEGFIRAEMQEIRERIAEEEGASDAAPAAWGRKKKKKSGNRIVKDLEKTLERLETRLKDALDAAKKDKAVYFEETGIDSLLVDEAHAFKSLPVYSRRAELKGVPTNRSNRATNMFMRTQWLLQNNGNRGVVFATGTPVTNTLAELFNMQRYLQIEELRERGLDKFDAWADVFTEATTNYEYTATGDYKPVTRLTNYVNLPELNSMARQVMETNFVDDLGHIKRPKKREHVHTVPISENQLNYIRQIKARAEMLKDYDYRKNSGDNYLVLSTDARKSALSTRLVDASITEDDGKIVKLTETVLRIAKERPGKTQMIFADMGVNPTEWNYSVYQDVIDRLVAGGIPKEKIINFGTAEGVKRQEAAAKLKAGEYWIGIGSTQKMGTGVNAQDLLTAMHHLDIAWVPAYVEQRNGRGHRQGNTNAEVEAHYYVTEGSFDLVMWQAVNRKWKGIQSFMRGGTERTMRMEDTGDEDSGELSPEMIMAAASGNPYELQRIQTRQTFERLQRAERAHRAQMQQYRLRVAEADRKIMEAEEQAKAYQQAASLYEETKGLPFKATIDGKDYDSRIVAGQALANYANTHSYEAYDKPVIGSYRGYDIIMGRSGSGMWGYLRQPGNDIVLQHFTLGDELPDQARLYDQRLRAAQTWVNDWLNTHPGKTEEDGHLAWSTSMLGAPWPEPVNWARPFNAADRAGQGFADGADAQAAIAARLRQDKITAEEQLKHPFKRQQELEQAKRTLDEITDKIQAFEEQRKQGGEEDQETAIKAALQAKTGNALAETPSTAQASAYQFNPAGIRLKLDAQKLQPGRFLSDGTLMLDSTAITGSDLEKLQRASTQEGTIKQESAQTLWDSVVQSPTTPATILGVVPDDNKAVVETFVEQGEPSHMAVDAKKLRLIARATGFDEVRVAKASRGPTLVAYKQNTPVGILMQFVLPQHKLAPLVNTLKAAAPAQPKAVTDAEQRLRENLTGERSGSGAQALVDQAIITGYKLYRAGMTFAEWSRAMLKEMGQAVRPHLKATWDRLLTAVRQFIADEEGSFPASPGPGRNAWATPEEVLGTTKAPTKGLGGIRMEGLGNVEETPKKQPRQRVVIDPLTGVRTVQKGGKPRTPREEMPDVPEIKMPRRLGGRDLRSPLTTLNQQGTYEALAGSLGKQVSDAFWDVTTQMATGELSRTQGIRELRAQLRPIKTELYKQGYRGMPEFIDAHVKQIESEEYDMFGGAARHLTALQYNLKLRFNPRAIAMNWLQPFQTLWPHFTTKEFVDLMAEARKRDVREQYKEIAARESGGKVEEATTKHPGWGNPFGMVSLTNRIMGHLAGLKIAERQGLTGLAKERMAAEWAAKVEYDNSARNVPPLFRRTPDLRGKLAAVLGQFKPFLIKNLERVAADWQTGIEGTSSGTLARRSKLVAAQMLIGGMKSLLLPGVKSLTGIFILAGLAKAFQGAGMDDDDANWWAEIAYFGLPAMIGQDFSSAVSLMDEPFGDTLEEQIVNFALGPTVSLATAIGTQGKDFFAAAQQYWKGERSPRAKRTPEQKMQGAALKMARTISPYTKTAIAGYYAVQGETPKMWLGKEERMTPGEAVGMGLMGTPVRQSVYWEKQEAYDWQKKALGMPMGKAGSGTPTRPTLNRPAPVRPRRATESR